MDKNTLADAKRRLAKIAGQVHGLEKMVDSDRNCIDILTQVGAIRSAVNQLGVIMLSTHLERCVNSNYSENTEPDALVGIREVEIKSTLKHFLNSDE